MTVVTKRELHDRVLIWRPGAPILSNRAFLTASWPGIAFVASITEHHDHDRYRQRPSHLTEEVRDAAGIQPGDRVEVRATASGAVIIEKPRAADVMV